MTDRGQKRKNNDSALEKSSRRHIDSSLTTTATPPVHGKYNLITPCDDWTESLDYLVKNSAFLNNGDSTSSSSSFSQPSAASSSLPNQEEHHSSSEEEWEDTSQYLSRKLPSLTSSHSCSSTSSSFAPSSVSSSIPLSVFDPINFRTPIVSGPNPNTESNSQPYPTSHASTSPSSTFTVIYPTSHPIPRPSAKNGAGGSFNGANFDGRPLDNKSVRNGVRVLPSLPSGAPPLSSSSSSSASASCSSRPPWNPNFTHPHSSSQVPHKEPLSHYSVSYTPDLPRDSRGGVQVLPTNLRRPSQTNPTPIVPPSSQSLGSNLPIPSTSFSSDPSNLPHRWGCLYRAVGKALSLFAQVPYDQTDYESFPSIPLISLMLTFSFIVAAISVELLPFWIVTVSCFIVWRAISPRRQTVHIFFDHSNLVWSSVHQRLTQNRKRLSYAALVRLIRRPKNILGLFSYLTSRCVRRQGTLFLAASTPAHSMHLENHPHWDDARKAGFELRVLPRLQREYAVDDVIHKAIANTVLKSKRWLCFGFRPRDIVVIVSGDANDNEGHGGFPQQASLALNQGFVVEVWAMRDSLGRRGYATLLQNPRFRMFELDRYLDELYS